MDQISVRGRGPTTSVAVEWVRAVAHSGQQYVLQADGRSLPVLDHHPMLDGQVAVQRSGMLYSCRAITMPQLSGRNRDRQGKRIGLHTNAYDANLVLLPVLRGSPRLEPPSATEPLFDGTYSVASSTGNSLCSTCLRILRFQPHYGAPYSLTMFTGCLVTGLASGR